MSDKPYTEMTADERRAVDLESGRYVCPRCQRISYNLNDILNRYCGACHVFEGDPLPPDAHEEGS